jgi:hypothetical protein
MAAFQREDDAAEWQQRNGVARVEGVLRDTRFLPHPSCGGSRGYDIPLHQIMVEAYQEGNPAPLGMLWSVQCWRSRLFSYRMTGNKASSELLGQYLLLLVMFKLIWPQSNYFECIVFIANETADAKIFSKKEVSRALQKLGYTTKVTSTIAY